jgi:hypothetical protein
LSIRFQAATFGPIPKVVFDTLTKVNIWDKLIRDKVLMAGLTFEWFFAPWWVDKIVPDA